MTNENFKEIMTRIALRTGDYNYWINGAGKDIELIKGLKWSEMNTGYIAAYKKDNNPILLHRYLTNCPEDLVVDHINHNRKDNRRSNLRICTQKENVANTEWKLGQSGVRGIRRDNGFWRVVIKNKYIGCSPDLEEAKRILEKYYKEYSDR